MIRLLFSFFFLLAACSSPPSSHLRIAWRSFPASVDPRKASDFFSSTLVCLLYDGLTRNLPDGSLQMALAERVEISEDQTVYTFYLREAHWSDGEPITALDFESSWKDAINPLFPSPCAYLFYPIKHAEAIVSQEKPLSSLGVRALDPKTLEVTLERPCPYFLSLTAFPTFLPVPRHIEKDLDTLPSPIVSGPFFIQQTNWQEGIYLAKNPTFWNKDHIRLNGIDILIVSDEMTALYLFTQNELDWLGGALSPLAPDAKEFLQDSSMLQYFPMAATTFCSFNTTKPPLDCPHFRKALSLAIPREEIVKHITQMGELNATRSTPPSLWKGENKLLFPSHSPELAKIHLQQSQYQYPFPPLTLIFRSNSTEKKIAQVLQKEWKKTLNIDIQLQETDFKTQKERLHQKNYDIALSYWIAQFHDPINILERFKDPQNLKNYPAWQNENYKQYLEQATQEKNEEKRLLYLAKAEELLANEAPIAPIYHWTNPSLCQPRLKNLHATPNGGILFEYAWIND